MKERREFAGRDVNAAVEEACRELGVDSSSLELEVVDTGSGGLFGFGRRSARILVEVKAAASNDDPFGMQEVFGDTSAGAVAADSEGHSSGKKSAQIRPSSAWSDEEGEATGEDAALVRSELAKLVELMGFPSQIDISMSGVTVNAVLHGEFEEELIGEGGRVVDSLQYLLRKIVGRRSSAHLRVNVDVGEWRSRRLKELQERALTLVETVRGGGHSEVMEGLNPAERREIHLLVQEQEGVGSRSVGSGMFKKVLIYRPGSGARPDRRSRDRRSR